MKFFKNYNILSVKIPRCFSFLQFSCIQMVAHVSKCFIFQNEQHLEDLIPVAYDVPKIRDSLSTIEEEHQEYDIPRNVNHALKNFDTGDDSDPLVNNSEENLYENQAYQDKKEVSKKQTVCLCRFRINFKK